MSLAVVILAAGRSSRLGSPKQLLEYKGKTLLQHAIDEAKAITPRTVIVVLGANAREIMNEFDDPDVVMLTNNRWEEGMASSIRLGISHIRDRGDDTAMIMVCDQPHVNRHLLERLYGEYRTGGKSIVAAEYDGKPGTPAVFHRSIFEDLLMLKGDKGAKQIIAENKGIAMLVDFPEGITDIDTREDYMALTGNTKWR